MTLLSPQARPWRPAAAAPGRHWRVAAITGQLDWSLRQRCSRERFDRQVADAWLAAYLAAQLARLETAAASGARLIVAPEYFAGTELFTLAPEPMGDLLATWEPRVLAAVQAVARRHQAWIALAMACRYGELTVETGILAHPGLGPPWRQIKVTALPPGHALGTGFHLFPLPDTQAALFTCSDLSDHPEAALAAARRGLGVLFSPGCGFAGDHWEAFLITRALDLGVPILHADDRRALVVDHAGRVVLRGSAGATVLTAELLIPAR